MTKEEKKATLQQMLGEARDHYRQYLAEVNAEAAAREAGLELKKKKGPSSWELYKDATRKGFGFASDNKLMEYKGIVEDEDDPTGTVAKYEILIEGEFEFDIFLHNGFIALL